MKTHLSEYIVLGNFSKWSINSFLSTKHLIEQGRKWTGKSYTTTQGEAEVLTIFPWHLTFLRRRMHPRAEEVRSMMGKMNPAVHPILYPPEYRKRPHTKPECIWACSSL
ncbi:uncharacterized protein LJ206_013013 isoform 2-T2 [Theristicus caerulescens]